MPTALQKLVIVFDPHWSALNQEEKIAVCRNPNEVVQCSILQRENQHYESHLLIAKHWGFGESTMGEDLPHSVASYFAHVALLKPTGLQQGSQGFVFIYTSLCMHRK